MGEMYVYEADCDDFDNFGICGLLTPTSCVFTEKANGISEVNMTHPIDDYKRYAELVVDRIISCEVPVRGIPKESDTSTARYYYAKIDTSATDRALYSNAKKSSKLLKTIPATQVESATSGTVDVKLYISEVDTTREMHKVRFTLYTYNKKKALYIPKAYSGWVKSESITTDDTWYEDVASGVSGAESIVPSWVVKPQLFRINNVETHDDYVAITAQHIFYDLLGTLTTVAAWGETTTGRSSCKTALGTDTDFDVTSDVTFGRAHAGFTDTNIVSAFLDTDVGLCKWYGANLFRDNFSIAVLYNSSYNRGVTIEYGKNLLGLKQVIDSSGIIDSIKPIGQTKKAEKLYLTAGDYVTEKYKCTVGADLCVYAGNVTDLDDEPVFSDFPEDGYPIRRRYVQDVGDSIKATANTNAANLTARKKLVDSAVDYFSSTGCYRESVTLDIDFINIGDTEEYRNLRELEGVHLYDIITLKHSKLGITALAQVTSIEYDAILDKVNSISIGTLNVGLGAEKIGTSQVPDSIKAQIINAADRPNAGFKTSVTLWSNLWTNGTQTVNVTGMDNATDIWVSPSESQTKVYSKAGIYSSAQGDGTLTFVCSRTPTVNIIVNITIIGGLVTW